MQKSSQRVNGYKVQSGKFYKVIQKVNEKGYCEGWTGVLKYKHNMKAINSHGMT